MRRSFIISTILFVIAGMLMLDERGTAGPERRKPAVPEAAAIGGKSSKKDSVAPELVKLESYMQLTAKTLDKKVQGALDDIDGTPRKLLALKYYLNRKSIKGSWAWTNKEMAAYRRSVDFRLANAEVDKVISLFQRTYPGHTLKTTKLARSLEDQIGLWNKTKSVAGASANLMKQAIKAMSTKAYPDTATKQSLAKFQKFLRDHSSKPVPTVAVPGLSHHGQLRAYDFIIWQGDKILAGSDGASIRNQWNGAGWGSKLRAIIYTASSKFDGPLQSPNEPWHYTYIR
jgi:hypothetical protein